MWTRYAFLSLHTIETMSGKLNKNSEFELEVPIENGITGIFPCTGAAILLRNGAKYRESLSYPVISQAGLKLRLHLSELKEVDFTIPLFIQTGHWSLHTYFPGGLGVSDIVNLLSELFRAGGSVSALHLPEDTALNQFKLYQIDLLTRQQELHLSMEYLMIQFALAKPWKLPVPYVTLERLDVGFEVTFGGGDGRRNLLTASAGGALSVTLGSYKLTMDLQMELPERSFLAQTKLTRKSEGPGLTELARSFNVTLPGRWQEENHLLGEITVYGSAASRSFAIEAAVYDILSFSVGDLKFSLKEVQAGAETATSHFRFFIQGVVEFDEGADAFSVYVKALYQDQNWAFSGGLYQGEINIGKLLKKVFRMEDSAEDVLSLAVTELAVSYTQKDQTLLLTAAFEAAWEITLLGESFILGGRIRLSKTGNEKPDLSALAYISIADFKVLVQIDHIQQKADRSFLFRLEYQKVYLQAAYFQREKDEILSVSLGGMTLGGLVESLVNKINPNKRYTLSAPWNLLNKIELSRFLFELNITKKQAGFLYRADLSIAGFLYIENIGVIYDYGTQNRKLMFVLTGKFPGDPGTENQRYTWDAIDGQPPDGKADNEKKFELSYLGLGQHLKNDGAAKADSIAEAVKALRDQLNPESMEKGPAYDAETNWLFGADFTVNGMLNIKIVLNDPVLYGILVTVNAKEQSALEAFDGFGIELLCRRVSSEVYMFRGELLMPKRFRTFQLGVVTLTLGTIRVDVYTNGGFCVDLGFPYQLDFSRSFVLEWGIFTGRGGIYFGIMKNVSVPNLPVASNGSFSPIVTLGVGLSVGLGRSFDLGIVKGGVSLEVFGVLEGVLAVFHEEKTQKESVYYYVKATIGIVGRLYLSVDFKILTIQASAEIRASAALTLQAYKASVIEVELELELKANIKILFIKIAFSFHFHQKVQFTIGKDEPAPWIEKQDVRTPVLRSAFRMNRPGSVSFKTEHIHLSLLPMFYLANPSPGQNAEKEYGAAFLMMMDEAALKQWTGLLAQWALSMFPEKTVTVQQIQALSPELADTMTYALLEDFLRKNVMISYDIHWEQEEKQLQEQNEDEVQRFVFPMLPSLRLSFGEKDREQQVNYWEEQPVSEDYFDMLTEYFRELNPDSSRMEESAAMPLEEEERTVSVPAAKAFFQDYFRMFLREVTGRIPDVFRQFVTEKGVCTAARTYGMTAAEILAQNTGLIFTPGVKLNFSGLNYTTMESDTIEDIRVRFSCDRQKLWESIRHETFLLRPGSTVMYGDGAFRNDKSGFTLEQAAVFLFVRFYEELVPSDMFYAGDIVRLNDEIDMDWKENLPGAHQLRLPDYDGTYHAMRGDTPARIGMYLNLLKMDKSGMEEWQRFYQDICTKNRESEKEIPSVVKFSVSRFTVTTDTDLADLADRIYPDREEELPDSLLCTAPVLRANTRITLPDISFTVPEDEEYTVGMLIASEGCTMEELGEAVSQDSFFLEKQKICLSGMRMADKEEILEWIRQDAVSIGTMLSRFLLQGLSVPEPDAPPEKTAPLFHVLRQMFPLGNGETDRTLKVCSEESGCTWVEADEKQRELSWEQIRERLPDGNFSVMPSPFVQLDDFVMSRQYFTLSDGAVYYRGHKGYTMYTLPKAVQETLRQGQKAPLLRDEDGKEQTAEWGCLLPVVVAKCEEKEIFSVCGADAADRLILHRLLSRSEPSVHLIYQASEVSKGGRNFLEYAWSVEESYMVRTNLSRETHMGYMKMKKAEASDQDEQFQNIVPLKRPQELLRMFWECSTVGGGGYYLRLKTADGQTLPDDIFDEQGMGKVWILLSESDYAALEGCINCCIFEDVSLVGNSVTLATEDRQQEKPAPVFPAGCVGLHSEMPAPSGDENIEKSQEYMRSLFQITGYQVSGNADYRESNMSAPLLPEEKGNIWNYNTVVPIYRYLSELPEDARENPYLCAGKQGRVVLMLKDLFGNTVPVGETQITPYYNDVLIGVGQYPAARVSYALLEVEGLPVLRLMFHCVRTDSHNEESLKYQRRASMQLACPDIQVMLDSPVSEERFSFSDLNKDGTSYLKLLQKYTENLADAMEQERPELVPDVWTLDFTLHTDRYPIPAQIFELKAVITVSRSVELAKNEAARHTTTVVAPSAFDAGEENEKNLLEFCREAGKALRNLYLAQTAEEDGVLYGISFGESGFIKELKVQPDEYEAETVTGERRTVQAPEYYALCPLYHGFLSRSAGVRILNENFSLSQELSEASFSDVDMELWAVQLLDDIETLLLAGPVKKAAVKCRNSLDALVKTKNVLAGAIAEQLLPLRDKAGETNRRLKEAVADRLKRSLREGYGTDILAACHLSFRTEGDENCRLTAAVQNDIEDTQASALKAESGKDMIALYFTNRFTGRSIPFRANLVFTELEYQIESGMDGYESSKWLRFVEPIRINKLESQVALPNPLKVCPQSPTLQGHTCSISSLPDDEHGLMEEKTERIGWEYTLTMRCRYREQDTFLIRVEFEDIFSLCAYAGRRDLFDILAEYSMARDKIWQAVSEAASDSETFRNAYESFVDIACSAGQVWESWVLENRTYEEKESGKEDKEDALVYSCMAEGIRDAKGLHFRLTSTEEGQRFLERFGLEEEEPFIETVSAGSDTEDAEIRFIMKRLPLFECAQATPFVKLIRNRNLLTGDGFALTVREDFIYRTQEVSLPVLPVTGEYTKECRIASMPDLSITQELMEKAVSRLYNFLQLDNPNLMAEVSVSYYYGLNQGKRVPRILLPVTLMPCTDTVTDARAQEASPESPSLFVRNLGKNIYQWYQNTEPDTNCCGLLFDISIYQKSTEKRLFHFAKLNVAFFDL